ncbi:glycoside hydrolase domain-containing protein [Sporosarcina sp. FSL K6-1508]|uniref:glycoside hydrolase domain-containing protein n=1 Tax=Sporosarcina sp. FSL K6-1508 TaxID=2921553 RepID=UPI0030F54392
MDEMVLRVQRWLNQEYRNDPGFEVVLETGKTGWSTMYALTRALQIELGIPNPFNNFGDGTATAYKKWGEMQLGSVPTDSKGKQIVYILQGACYCKGYNPGGFDGNFGEGLKSAVQKLQTDAGLPVRDGKVYDYVFKAFLTMDAYVLTAGGNSRIREIQQSLNYSYYKTAGVQPTDGFYQRNTNKALIYGLQTEIGIAPNNQTGSIGPATTAGLPTLLVGSRGNFVKLFQYALYVNNYDSGTFDGIYGTGVKSAVTEFQKFVGLDADGIAGKQAWLSVLTSTGDPNRKGTACDCITEITPARAQTLKNAGYQTVGRYLINVPGGLDKKIQPGELKTIFDAGLTVFPIYQTNGASSEYFGPLQGAIDGEKALISAQQHGFKDGTTIYFSVDFDALGGDIPMILEYYQAIITVLGGKYKVGVYGPRSICIEVSKLDGISYSFVSGMSTGFSGNLGYPLPRNWAFDQILEYAIGSGEGRIAIDKDIKSGRDNGQSSVSPITPPILKNEIFLDKLDELQRLAASQNNPHAMNQTDWCLDYLRNERFNNEMWDIIAGSLDGKFVDKAVAEFGRARDFPQPLDPDSKEQIDLPHLAATCDTVIMQKGKVLSDIAGWGGDLLTTLKDAKRLVEAGRYDTIYKAAYATIGGIGESHFSYSDLLSDLDGYNIGMQIVNKGHAQGFSKVVRDYYSNGWKSRYSDFYQNRFASSPDRLYDDANYILNDVDPLIVPIRYMFVLAFDIPFYLPEEGRAVAEAWRDKFLVLVGRE